MINYASPHAFYSIIENVRTIFCVYITIDMLVKVNSIDTIKNEVKVTLLDIDDYGSVIPLKDLELNIPADESVIQTLKNSSYAAIFTEGNIEENGITIILASGMTVDELNKEKSKTIDRVASARQI
jgi:hypothetical protein